MRRLILAVAVALCLAVGAGVTCAATADGATIVVDTQVDELVDNGNCSLREALQAANTDTPVDACPAGGAVDTIEIHGGVYTLDCGGDGQFKADGLDILTGTVVLQGSVITPTILDGGGGCRVLHVHKEVTATVSSLTIRGGLWPIVVENEVHVDDPDGAGIRNDGSLQIENCTIVNNATGEVWHDPYNGYTRFPGGGVYNSGSLTISSSNVISNSGGAGAGVYNTGSLTIDKSTVAGCQGGLGSGVNNNGKLTISDSTITDNHTVTDNQGDSGAGIYNNGFLTIANSTIAGNHGYSGAGVYNNWVLLVTHSAITGNVSEPTRCSVHGGINCYGPNEGGGIANWGFATVANSTISDNQAGDVTHEYFGLSCNNNCLPPGGGGAILNTGMLVLDNATIAQNRAGILLQDETVRGSGGGIVNRGTLRLQNTLIANNEHGDCIGTLELLGRNLIESTSGYTYTLTGDLGGNVLGQSAGLRALADNGGPTRTHALSGWSAAIDAGSCIDSQGQPITQDQRGEPRPQLGGCDIGAYEAAAIEPYEQEWLPAVRLEE
jgi:CSLREA domain-containing protein